MSTQMESLTQEVFYTHLRIIWFTIAQIIALRDTADKAESLRKLAEISDSLRSKNTKLEDELRLATHHFQSELIRAEKYGSRRSRNSY